MSDQRSPRLLKRFARPIAAALLAAGIVVVAPSTPASAADFVVDSTSPVLDADVAADDGLTTLADAVYLANTTPEPDTITFDLDPTDAGPIDTLEVPPIAEDLTIVGPGRSRITLTRSTGDVLRVENGAMFTLSDLAIDGAAGGSGPYDGLILDSFGDVVLERVDIANVGVGVGASQPGVDPLGSFVANDVTVSTTTGNGISLQRVGVVTLVEVEVAEAAAVAGVSIVTTTDVSITDGSLSSGTGSGLYVEEFRDLTVTGTTISDNDAFGVDLRQGYGATSLVASTISGNGDVGVVVDGSGAVAPVGETLVGAVAVAGSVIADNDGGGVSVSDAGDITLSDLEITGNGVAPSSGLGGVYLGTDGTPSLATIERSVISGNSGADGGGITTSDHDGELTITESTIGANRAAGGKAMSVASTVGDGLVQVVRSEISDHTEGLAPVVYDDGVPMRIVDSNVTGNVAGALFESTGGEGISVRQSTITGNSFGDAVFRNADSAFMETIESTVTGNTGTVGGGGVFRRIAGGGQLVAVNTVLSGNGVPVAAGASLAPVPDVTYSVVPTGTPAGTGNVVADDPGVGPLTDNDGPLPTMLPAVGSPAVDAGDPAGSTIATTTDQRGLDRVVDGRIDIGAVERQESPFVVGLPPARVLETRSGPGLETIDGEFEAIGRRGDGQELTLDVAGRAGVPLDAEAVVVNVTAVQPSGVGFITVHPCLVNPPLASSLNFRSGADNGNEIIAQLDDEGDLCLFNRTATHLVVDVVGYVPAASRYTAVGPARLLDTRSLGATVDGQFQQGGIRGSDTELALDVAGRGGVTDDAVAVVINVTAVNPVDIGYVTVHPCLPEEPTAASLNFEPGVNRGNEIIAQLDAQGRLCLYTFGSAELVVDVVGELSDENVYTPVPPARLVETRDLPNESIDGVQQGVGRLVDGQTLTVDVAGRAAVPAGAGSVIVNVTAVRPEVGGFITVWDCTGTMPLASSLNYVTDEIVGNELVVALDGGEFCVFTSRATHLTVDVVAHLT